MVEHILQQYEGQKSKFSWECGSKTLPTASGGHMPNPSYSVKNHSKLIMGSYFEMFP